MFISELHESTNTVDHVDHARGSPLLGWILFGINTTQCPQCHGRLPTPGHRMLEETVLVLCLGCGGCPSVTPSLAYSDDHRWQSAVERCSLPRHLQHRGQSHTSWPRTINLALINFAEVNWRVLWRWSCSDLSLTLLINSPESRQPGVTCWLESRVLWPQLGDCHVTGAKRLLLLITPVQQQRH